MGRWFRYERARHSSILISFERIHLAAGFYKIRIMLMSGYTQTTPANNFGNNATLASGEHATGRNFGVDN